MKRLLLADVHANLPALKAVLDDVGKADEIWILGDLVGFGPNPDECISLLREINAVCICGNHDIDLKEYPDRDDWNKWTFRKIKEENRNFLFSLPDYLVMDDGSVLMHHFPGFLTEDLWRTPRMVRNTLPGISGRRVLFGHEHFYTCCTYKDKQYLCVPAVGQQRNGSPDAQYLVEEDGVIQHRTVPYDVERLVHDLKLIGLDPVFMNRWIHFVQTGFDKEWSYRVPKVLCEPPFPPMPLFADTCLYE